MTDCAKCGNKIGQYHGECGYCHVYWCDKCINPSGEWFDPCCPNCLDWCCPDCMDNDMCRTCRREDMGLDT